MVKIRVLHGEAQMGAVFLAEPVYRRQMGVRRGSFVPLRFDLRKHTFRHGAPEDFFGTKVVRDQRMLQTGSLGNVADAGCIEAIIRKFRQGPREYGAPGVDRTTGGATGPTGRGPNACSCCRSTWNTLLADFLISNLSSPDLNDTPESPPF